MNRIEIRRKIHMAGNEFYQSIKDRIVQNIAGEFMGLNEEYVLNHQDENETYGTQNILANGFTTNQRRWIKLIDRGE